jgi:chemotaxis protein methyltransferase CheR
MELTKVEEFVRREYGINLSAYKSKQLVRRIENFFHELVLKVKLNL